MQKRRDRHGRGLRGPLALPNPLTGHAMRLVKKPSDAQFFVDCVSRSVNRIQQTCPQALTGVEVAVEEAPVKWGEFTLGAVPLAAALESEPEKPARVIVFRHPLERRAEDRAELRSLVHLTLVEQLSALTLLGVDEIDPGLALS